MIALATTSGALAVVLLIPNLYSDPNGLDPYLLRVSGVALALLLASLGFRRLAPARLALVSYAAITLAWSAFQGTPRALQALGVREDSDHAILWASVAQLLVTLIFLAFVRWRQPAPRPVLRLGSFGGRAVLVTLGGIMLFTVAALMIPAGLLGRYGLALVALRRDLPLLAPACALQAAAQELQFRGLLLATLEQVTSARRANLGQAVIFGLAHLAIVYQGPVAPFIPVTMALGVLLGLTTQRTGSLWPAIIIHAIADIAVTAAVLPGLYGY